MAQFKVPQNVESEDKLIGPLSMKQFIYALIGLGWGFLWWRVFSIAGPIGYLLMALVIIPISGFMFLLAFGRREEQSFENYLIALIRFNVMPRRRLWLKDDTAGHVIVDAPKAPDPIMPSREDNQRMQSRLQQLALVVDTRGHVKSDEVQQVDPTNQAAEFSQRVFTPTNLQQEMVVNQMQASDDILADTEGGQRAQEVGQLLQNVEQKIRQDATTAMTQPQEAQSPRAPITSSNPVAPTSPPVVNDAIIKTVMNTADLSVAQVAQVANRGQLDPGQTAQLRSS